VIDRKRGKPMQRRKGFIAFAALSALLLCGAGSTPKGCNDPNFNVGVSQGQIVGAAVGVGAVIAVGTIVIVEVHKSHHTVKGCVTAGPDGIQLHTEDGRKVYALTGVTTSVQVGDIVKLHGNKEKHQKDAAGDQDFMIQKMSRDYGPCKAVLAAPPSAVPATGSAP
jgi:hypothetical protein